MEFGKVIRKISMLDIPRVMDIWLNATIQGHPFIPEDYWYNNYDTVKNVWIPSSDTYVDEREGKVLGFVSVLDNTLIGALFVDFEQQGIGIGTALINYIKNLYSPLTLEVYKENRNAVRFYRSCGFVIADEKKAEDNDHILYVMAWKKE